MIAAEKANYPVAVLCRVLCVDRTSFHDWERRPPSDRALQDAWLTAKIIEVRDNLRQLHPYRHVSPEELRIGARLLWEAHFLVIAIRQLLMGQEAYMRQTGDRRLADARAAFDAAVPHAKNFRDLLEHIDEYLLDRGKLQREERIALGLQMQAVHERITGRVSLRLGEHELDLDEASNAALALAEVTAEVWFERTKGRKETNEPDATSP